MFNYSSKNNSLHSNTLIQTYDIFSLHNFYVPYSCNLELSHEIRYPHPGVCEVSGLPGASVTELQAVVAGFGCLSSQVGVNVLSFRRQRLDITEILFKTKTTYK